MHLSGQTTTFQTRLEISEHAAAGLHDRQIAAIVGCSVWTVRKWRRRVLHYGRVGLISRMGRPARGPLSTFPLEVKAAILHLRKLHPDWGPNTLLAALKIDTNVRTHPLPSRAQLARLLKHTGLTCHYQLHHDLPYTPGASVSTSHHLTGLTAETVLKPDGHDFMRLNTSVLPPSPTQNEQKSENPIVIMAATVPQQIDIGSFVGTQDEITFPTKDPSRSNITTTTTTTECGDDKAPKLLAHEAEKGFIHLYEVGGKGYYQVNNWKKMQRMKFQHPLDYPPPPDTEDGPLEGKEEPSPVNAETPQLSSSSRSSSDEKRKEITTTTKSECVSDDLDKFVAYEEQQGQAWRTEQEIDADRQKFLTRWLPIVPDIKEGQYPFKDVKLARADVEWLLASSGDEHGPVHCEQKRQTLVGACLEHACFSDEKGRGPPG